MFCQLLFRLEVCRWPVFLSDRPEVLIFLRIQRFWWEQFLTSNLGHARVGTLQVKGFGISFNPSEDFSVKIKTNIPKILEALPVSPATRFRLVPPPLQASLPTCLLQMVFLLCGLEMFHTSRGSVQVTPIHPSHLTHVSPQ